MKFFADFWKLQNFLRIFAAHEIFRGFSRATKSFSYFRPLIWKSSRIFEDCENFCEFSHFTNFFVNFRSTRSFWEFSEASKFLWLTKFFLRTFGSCEIFYGFFAIHEIFASHEIFSGYSKVIQSFEDFRVSENFSRIFVGGRVIIRRFSRATVFSADFSGLWNVSWIVALFI